MLSPKFCGTPKEVELRALDERLMLVPMIEASVATVVADIPVSHLILSVVV